uniref:Uncharacterized protein n=1 Tax=Megaselia scalaris TaxID=36166 RepID=T1H2I7_MEGSC
MFSTFDQGPKLCPTRVRRIPRTFTTLCYAM